MRSTWLSAKWVFLLDARTVHHARPQNEADAPKVSACTASKTDVLAACGCMWL